jgi:PHD/YefM family antitoxin component YafN of YafNO toxin-antitoxin module
MMEVTATEFAKAFGRYNEEAQREPIAITSYGRVSGYFVSAREYEELQRLRAFARRVRRIKDLPTEIAEAIQAAIQSRPSECASGRKPEMTELRQSTDGRFSPPSWQRVTEFL